MLMIIYYHYNVYFGFSFYYALQELLVQKLRKSQCNYFEQRRVFTGLWMKVYTMILCKKKKKEKSKLLLETDIFL